MKRIRIKALNRLGMGAAIALALLVGALSFAPRAVAQGSGGTLPGKVVDKSGSALPGVTVTASQKGTGYERNTATAADGTFRLPALVVGDFNVKADLPGF